MYCENCGAQMREGAAFCPYCGKAVGTPGSVRTEGNPGAQGSPVIPSNAGFSGINPVPAARSDTTGGAFKKKKHKGLLIAIPAVLVVLLVVILIGRGRSASSSGGHGTSSSAASVDSGPALDGDVLRGLQGDWYLWEEDGDRTVFSFNGTKCTKRVYIYYDRKINMGSDEAQIKATDVKGELILYVNVHNAKTGEKWEEEIDRLYYKYDENEDRVELTYLGQVLSREDEHKKIHDLLQGEWIGADKTYFTFSGSSLSVKTGRNTYSVGYLLYPDGRIFFEGYGFETDRVILYEYDEEADSIVLTYEDEELKKQ